MSAKEDDKTMRLFLIVVAGFFLIGILQGFKLAFVFLLSVIILNNILALWGDN